MAPFWQEKKTILALLSALTSKLRAKKSLSNLNLSYIRSKTKFPFYKQIPALIQNVGNRLESYEIINKPTRGNSFISDEGYSLSCLTIRCFVFQEFFQLYLFCRGFFLRQLCSLLGLSKETPEV